MNDRHEDVHQINGPRQRLHPQFQGREVYKYHQAHQPKQDGSITNNCLIVGLLLIVIALVIVVSIGLGIWLYQCNTTEKDYTKINEKLAHCQQQLNDIKFLFNDKKNKVDILRNDLRSEQNSSHIFEKELVKCLEREKIKERNLCAGWEEKYEECFKNSEEISKKLQICQGNDTIKS